MAKKSEPNNDKTRFERESRLNRIENCTQCHGNPEAKDFNLQGLVGKYCNTCMEIISYHKEGKPHVVVEKKRVIDNTNFQSPDYKGKEAIEVNAMIPGVGTIDFKDFKLE